MAPQRELEGDEQEDLLLIKKLYRLSQGNERGHLSSQQDREAV